MLSDKHCALSSYKRFWKRLDPSAAMQNLFRRDPSTLCPMSIRFVVHNVCTVCEVYNILVRKLDTAPCQSFLAVNITDGSVWCVIFENPHDSYIDKMDTYLEFVE